MKLIYVCSPYSGDIPNNTIYAQKASRMVVDMGHIPIAPHLLFPQFMSEESERELALKMDLKLIDKCYEVWVFGERMSKGMQMEVDYAVHKGMFVRFVNLEREGK